MYWKHKYFEKNSKELHTNIFRSLEIEQYLKQVFKNKGFNLHNYKLNFSNFNLNIFLSVYKSNKKKLLYNSNLKAVKKDLALKKHKFINKLKIKIKKYCVNKKNLKKSYNKIKYIKTLKFYKNYHLMTLQSNKLKTLEFMNFSKKILESLKLFTDNNFNVTLTINEINYIYFKIKEKENLRNSHKLKKTPFLKQGNKLFIPKALINFRKFQKTPFFEEGIKLFIPMITQHNSAKLLIHYITTQLGIIKRHNFFFYFLKESLSAVAYQKFSKIQGIKILIKGRLNNAARSQSRIIKIGTIPLITINSKIDYSESTVFTSNGTLGVKVWVCEKK